MQKKTLVEIKQEERELIAFHIKAYLARGHQIKVYPAGATGVDLKKRLKFGIAKCNKNGCEGN